jgi:TetR/AcrR family transcriptional regulator, repressor of fatR-cypB operon
VRIKDNNKRIAIRDAAVHVVIQSGLGSASVARIAARAGVSVGTVYLYYSNKDELLQEVYLEIKQEFHQFVMARVDPTQSSAHNLRAMWFAIYEHLVLHPDDFVFSELVSAARLLDAVHQDQIEHLAADMVQVLHTALADGTLHDLPVSALRALLIAPATHLARQAATQGKPLEADVVEQAFDALWRAVAKNRT